MVEQINSSYIKYIKNIGISSFLQDNPNNFYLLGKNKNQMAVSADISEIKNINELIIFISNSTFFKSRKNNSKIILDSFNNKVKVMLIGGVTSFDDNKIGRPFGGETGNLLSKMLEAINLKRKDVYMANIFPFFDKNNFTDENILECLPFIQRQIEIIEPKIIILLGDIASKAVLNVNLGITDLRGKWHNYKSINSKKSIPCLASYHPNFLLNNTNFKKQSWEDLKKLKEKIDE